MKKNLFLFITALILFSTKPSFCQVLFDDDKLYLIQTVLPTDYAYTYNGTDYSFLIGDTVYWCANADIDGTNYTHGPKLDAVYPVKKVDADLSDLQLFWIIENDGNTSPDFYAFKNKYHYDNGNSLLYINQWGGATNNDLYLLSSLGSNCRWEISDTTDAVSSAYKVGLQNQTDCWFSDILRSHSSGYQVTSQSDPSKINILESEPLSPPATSEERAALQSSIDSATTIRTNTVEGNALGQYSTVVREAIQTTINEAQTIHDNSGATSLEVISAQIGLNDAIALYYESMNMNINELEVGNYLIRINAGSDNYLYLTDTLPHSSGNLQSLVLKEGKAISDSLRQQVIKIAKDGERYRMDSPLRIDSSFARTYVNEKGLFGSNPYSYTWNTMAIKEAADKKFAIQRGGSAGTAYWFISDNKLGATGNLNVQEYLIFELIKDYSVQLCDSLAVANTVIEEKSDSIGPEKVYPQAAYDSLLSSIDEATIVYNTTSQTQENFMLSLEKLSNSISVFYDSKSYSRDASLASITYGGAVLTDFSAEEYNYQVELAEGTTQVPEVIGVATDASATVVVRSATSLPGTTNIDVVAENGVTKLTYSVLFSVASETDATLSSITIDGESLDGFNFDTYTYEIIVPFGTITVPEVLGTPTDANAQDVTVSPASALPGVTTILVTAEDGETTLTYSVNFKFESNTDATLASISVGGETLAGFSSDTYVYYLELPASTTTLPEVIGTAMDSNATVTVIPVSGLPGTTTIEVIAEDGITELSYTINFSVITDIDILEQEEISVYPTISTGKFRINLGATGGTILIYKISGIKVVEFRTTNLFQDIYLDNEGIYLLRVINQTNEKAVKLLVRH